MNYEPTMMLDVKPTTTLGELVMGLAHHFKASGTDRAEFEFDGMDGKTPVKMTFSVSMKAVQ